MKIIKQIICSSIFFVFLMMITGTAIAGNVNLELVGHFGGKVNDVEVAGDYAYLGLGQNLVILNISDTGNLLEVGNVLTPSMVTDISVVGNYAYVADRNNGLVIVDVSNPASPTLVGSYNTAG